MDAQQIPPGAQAHLVIVLLENGQIQTSGCITNEMLALWMLEKAKDAIKAFNLKQAEQPLIAPARLVGFPRNGG